MLVDLAVVCVPHISTLNLLLCYVHMLFMVIYVRMCICTHVSVLTFYLLHVHVFIVTYMCVHLLYVSLLHLAIVNGKDCVGKYLYRFTYNLYTYFCNFDLCVLCTHNCMMHTATRIV